MYGGAAGRVSCGLRGAGGGWVYFSFSIQLLVMSVMKSIPGMRPAARSWVLFFMDRMVLVLALLWFLVRWFGRWVLGYGVLGSAVSMLFSNKEMVGAGFGRDWWRWFARLGYWCCTWFGRERVEGVMLWGAATIWGVVDG